MDQIKIGKFIAEERKQHKLTQRQLAEALNISDKTVSKWETGNGLPEISLMVPLCTELEISVNELLSGERLEETEYKKKAEENIMDFIKEREENKRRIRNMVIVMIVTLIASLTLFVIVKLYGNVLGTGVSTMLLIIALAITVGGFYVGSHEERTVGYYKCGKCGKLFIPKTSEYLLGVHMGMTRRLKCHECGERCWCKKVYSRED